MNEIHFELLSVLITVNIIIIFMRIKRADYLAKQMALRLDRWEAIIAANQAAIGTLHAITKKHTDILEKQAEILAFHINSLKRAKL